VSERVPDRPAEASERPAAIERLLFARIELWVVVLLLLLGCLLAIGFGAAVLDAEREDFRLGPISRAALSVAEIPQATKQLLTRDTDLRVGDSERERANPTGWSFPTGRLTEPRGYLLISRYDGTAKRQRIELVALPAMRTVYRWTPDASDLLQDVRPISRFAETTNWNDTRYRAYHPWLESNGDLVIKDYASPLFRIDPCGKRVWKLQEGNFHHSTEGDADGDLWIPGIAERPGLAGVNEKFREDTINKISPSGKLLFSRSVAQILVRHGYANWLFTLPNDDPTHLNDIEPVVKDGPYWKKGDLFLSMRNVSAVLLYRPSTDQIVWIKRGPWIAQHDVDILDDHRISIYDNHVEERAPRKPYFADTSQVLIYDFATHQLSRPLEGPMKRYNFRTWVEGLFIQLPGGLMLVADPTQARLLIFRPDGRVAARFVNRAKDGNLYQLAWSRYIDAAKGDAIVRTLQKVKCNA